MNTSAPMTLEEILSLYGRKKLPRGTTEDAWRSYHEDMVRHKALYEERRPKIEHFNSADDFRSAYSEWDMNRACFEPNYPGQEYANNH